ncbi:hypothetical protein BD779DRAFT_1535473 [Infundibulicybe gibba]|nr:hypothetical protein BD779DRAFT_1535473 [Infundibulicybe gibba]
MNQPIAISGLQGAQNSIHLLVIRELFYSTTSPRSGLELEGQVLGIDNNSARRCDVNANVDPSQPSATQDGESTRRASLAPIPPRWRGAQLLPALELVAYSVAPRCTPIKYSDAFSDRAEGVNHRADADDDGCGRSTSESQHRTCISTYPSHLCPFMA